MNYDQPRPLTTGGWHYTRRNDDQVWPIGYCADHPPHATEDEARECYASYVLNETMRLDGRMEAYYPCQVGDCGVLTNAVVSLGGWATMYRLCDEHRTREKVAELYGSRAGNRMHS